MAAAVWDSSLDIISIIWGAAKNIPLPILLLILVTAPVVAFGIIYCTVLALAPAPRPALQVEKTYVTSSADGSVPTRQLPCWHDGWLAHRHEAENEGDVEGKHTGSIDEAELEMSVVIPAYNEEGRIEIMLEEAVAFLDAEYGRTPVARKTGDPAMRTGSGRAAKGPGARIGGYEILVVNDGSRDKTIDVVLEFSRRNGLHDIIRICTLKENRGKGGAVTHGFRHVRGAYTVFADADGASRFSDLRKLVEGCDAVADGPRRGIAVGSRAHLVGSEAVVKRSFIRNALMRSFHILLSILTPPATSRIRDTQCGFKLFSRAALPHIVPYMHVEGWIFDVEMLMLAESAPEGVVSGAEGRIGTTPGIRVAEVPIGWKEVGGSKLNVLWDSLGMAWGLALLRASWMMGVYRRR